MARFSYVHCIHFISLISFMSFFCSILAARSIFRCSFAAFSAASFLFCSIMASLVRIRWPLTLLDGLLGGRFVREDVDGMGAFTVCWSTITDNGWALFSSIEDNMAARSLSQVTSCTVMHDAPSPYTNSSGTAPSKDCVSIVAKCDCTGVTETM